MDSFVFGDASLKLAKPLSKLHAGFNSLPSAGYGKIGLDNQARVLLRRYQ